MGRMAAAAGATAVGVVDTEEAEVAEGEVTPVPVYERLTGAAFN